MKDMMEIITALPEEDRLAAVEDYEAYLVTGLFRPSSKLLLALDSFREQHSVLSSTPRSNAIKDFAAELYRFYAKKYLDLKELDSVGIKRLCGYMNDMEAYESSLPLQYKLETSLEHLNLKIVTLPS